MVYSTYCVITASVRQRLYCGISFNFLNNPNDRYIIIPMLR